MIATHLTPEEWTPFAPLAMRAVFGEKSSSEPQIVSGAYLFEEDEKPFGFLTYLLESDSSVYFPHLGVVENVRGSSKIVSLFSAILHSFGEYSTIRAQIYANNPSCMRVALKFGFQVTGCHKVDEKVIVELERKS